MNRGELEKRDNCMIKGKRQAYQTKSVRPVCRLLVLEGFSVKEGNEREGRIAFRV